MTTRNLDRLFKPRSIAVIGASRRPGSVGHVLARNLFAGGFDGPILAVHPKASSIESTLAYRSVDDLPIAPDLAVIATPPDSVPGIVDQLGRRGTKAAVVISAGFGEAGDDAAKAHGKHLMQAMLDAARPHLLRIVGPNCVGVLVPGLGLNASFAHLSPKTGNIAFVTQSGAMATAVIDWATHRGIGFSHIVSLGDMGDVDFGDMLDYLAADPATGAILLYVEALTDARKFMSAGRAAARGKPVIVIKAGRSEAAARAAASHTGALAGSDAVYDAAFRRAGMLRVFDLAELFDAAETLATGFKVRGERLAILTNGGGIGVLATDALIDHQGRLADLSPETMARLDQVLPPTWSRGNPVDIIGDAPGERYTAALDALLADRGVDAVLVMNCPTAVADPLDAARAVVGAMAERRRVPVLTSWLGDGTATSARRLFATRRIPTYDTPGAAARAFMHLVRYRRNQDQLMQTPPSRPDGLAPDPVAARALIDAALAEGREVLTEPEAKRLLAAYQIPAVETMTVADPGEAGAAAEGIGGSVALKILSPDISHKSDVGGVRLNLEGSDEVRHAATAMLEQIGRNFPGARLQGFTVQRMADMPGAHELILGLAEDATFGPTILFGQGGTAVEVVQDTAIALPPLNLGLARDQMARTRIWRLLQGYRDRPAADLDAIALSLTKLAQIAVDLPEVVELDINPLLASDRGVLALDARVRVRKAEAAARRRLAIRPMPRDLEGTVEVRDGRQFAVRAIMPEDEPAIQAMIARSSPDDVRLRFFTSVRTLSHQVAARLTQIDYDREMALVAVGPDDRADGDGDGGNGGAGNRDGGNADGGDTDAGTGGQAIYGVVRIAADPNNERAEYGVMIRSDMKGQGLGRQLMQRIIDHARRRGIGQVFGEVLRENRGMLRLASQLGFSQHPDPDDAGIIRVAIDLADLPADAP